MSHWQVTFKSAAGQVVTFGVEAPDETSAFQRALPKVPFYPFDKFCVVEIPPLCAKHGVRHDCGNSGAHSETG
jgi:hypothetical protein